jgi:Bacterial membrane protein YfhO
LPLKLCLLLAAAQGLCWVMARGLGVRLPPRAAALGLALPLLFLSPFLIGDVLLAPTGVLAGALPLRGLPPVSATHLIQSDTLYQFLPWELEVRHALRQLRLPFWSDLLDGGSSPWINPQAGVLSPLAMLARALPIQHFLLGMLALKMMLAGEGTWLLARQVGVSRASAGLAAAGFALGGGMMSWALFPHTATLAWVPWLTLGSIRLVRRPRARVLAVTAAIAAALLLSGHPETAAAGGLLAAAASLSLGRTSHRPRATSAGGESGLRWRAARGGGRVPLPRAVSAVLPWPLARGAAAAALAALLGFALAAPQLLPFLRAVPAAQRTRDMLAVPIPAHDARLLAPASWFLSATASYLVAPVNPRVYGIPYEEPYHGPINWVEGLSGYGGLVAFAGAVVALLGWGWRRGRRARPWLAFAVLSLLLAAGFVPFALLARGVPALRLPAYSRLLPVACLALAVAGGFGTDLLLRRRLRPAARWRAVAALGLAAAVSLAADRSPYVLLLWGLLVAAALAAMRWRLLAAAALALALGLDLVPWAEQLLPRGQAALFYPPNELTRAIARETGPAAALGGGGAGPARAVGIDRLVYPSLLPVYGIAELRPNNVMAPASYLRVLRDAFAFDPTMSNYYSTFSFPDHPLLAFLGVRVVVGAEPLRRPRTLELPPAPPASQLSPFLVFRNPRALPRWFVPAAVEAIDRAALDRWIMRLADPARVAVFGDELPGAGLRLAAAAPGSRTGGAAAAARALAATPGHALLAVPGGGTRLLATSLPGPAGWRARAGGRPLAELTVDGAFLGVVVPAGVTQVELTFRPPGLAAGLALAALALPVVLALAAAGRRRPATGEGEVGSRDPGSPRTATMRRGEAVRFDGSSVEPNRSPPAGEPGVPRPGGGAPRR